MKDNLKQTLALVAGCLVILGALFTCRNQYAMAIQSSLAEKVLRFHVLANSDEEYDQEIKLAVRDEVSCYVTQLLEESDSLEETVAIMQLHLEDINAVANQVLEENGVAYRATTTITYMDFPEKEYDGFVFPEGEYQALRIVLGKGEGHNWWCVMYPNLCFSESLYKTNKDELFAFKKVLTEEECEAIMNRKDYTIRFKLLEYLEKKVYN